MSLVPTFVQAVDGKYYENPTLRGVDSDGARWFLCFDDDDPPELVIERKNRKLTINHGKAILAPLGFKYEFLMRQPQSSGRLFGKSLSSPSADAGAFFIKIKSAIPVPTEFDSVVTRAEAYNQQCALYEFEGASQ